MMNSVNARSAGDTVATWQGASAKQLRLDTVLRYARDGFYSFNGSGHGRSLPPIATGYLPTRQLFLD